MPTGKSKLYTDPAVVLGAQETEGLRTFNTEELDAALAAIVFGTDGLLTGGQQFALLGSDALTFSTAAATGDTRTITLTSTDPDLRKHTVIAHRGQKDAQAEIGHFELLTFLASDQGFTGVPFRNNGTGPYRIALRANAYPATVNIDLNGQVVFDKWADGIGDQYTPGTVTDLGGGSMRLDITTAATMSAWSDTGETRPCTAWKNDPVTGTSEAIFSGSVSSNGTICYVDVTHYFGQGTPSLTGTDYTVHVHGLTINDEAVQNLATIDDATTGIALYWIAADFDAVALTLDYASQVRFPSLQDLGISTTIAHDKWLSDTWRAGCYLGDYEATREWNEVAAVTLNDGVAPATITFGNAGLGVSTDLFFAAGDTIANDIARVRILKEWATNPNGYVAEHLHSAATGTYVVIATAVPYDLDAYDYRVRLRTVLESSLTAQQQRRVLKVFRFDWTTETSGGANDGTFSNAATIDLMQKRGYMDGRAFGSEAEATDNHLLSASEVFASGDDGFRLSFRARDSVTPGTHTSELIAALYRSSVTLNRFELFGSLGEVSGTAQDLPAGEKAEFHIGGNNDWFISGENNGGARQFRVGAFSGTADIFTERTGGNANTVNGRTSVQDLHLATDKDVERSLPLIGAKGQIMPTAIDGIKVARPTMTIIDAPIFETNGNSTADEFFHNAVFINGQDLAAGDLIRLRTRFQINNVAGNGLNHVRMNVRNSAGAGGTNIFDEGDATPNLNDYADFEVIGVVESTGTTGTINWFVYGVDVSAGNWIAAAAAADWRALSSTGITIDTTSDIYLVIYSQWAVASASQSVRSLFLQVERSRSDLWHWDNDSGEDRWLCERGHQKQLDIPIPADQGYGHSIVSARIYCGLGSTATGDELDLTLYEYDPGTDTLSSLATGTQSGTGGWVTLTPGSPELIEDGKRYFVRVQTDHSATTATTPGFYVRAAEMTTRMSEIH